MKRELKKQIRLCLEELKEIDKLIAAAPLDSKVPFLTMYALIKSCGTVEYVFKSIIADFCERTRITQLQNYIEISIREAPTSPKYDNILNLLNKFDNQWHSNFKNNFNAHPDAQRLRASLNSLVTNRHQFAHGRIPPVSFNSIKTYFIDAIEVLKILDAIVQ